MSKPLIDCKANVEREAESGNIFTSARDARRRLKLVKKMYMKPEKLPSSKQANLAGLLFRTS
jgi:hypothetical protein